MMNEPPKVSTTPAEELLASVETLLKDVRIQQKQIKRTLIWVAVGSYLRLFLIIVPIIVGIFFLPKLLSQVFAQTSGGSNQIFSEILKTYTP